MSHAPQREEKICLNCGTMVVGRFCHVCGQENLEPKESVWHLVSHFFNDITHFDGKFFLTLKVLLLHPGRLSKEYMLGKRASFLNPVRMYVFTSAIFFLLFFSFFQKSEEGPFKATFNGKNIDQIAVMDSASFAEFTRDLSDSHKPMTRTEFRNFVDTQFSTGLHFGDTKYNTRAQYDSALASGKRNDNWLERQFVYKEIAINNKYNNNTKAIAEAFSHSLIHSLPQMLFLSLPLLALILKLLYIRRKQFYYVSHGIFGIHFYIFLFIDLLVIFTLSTINHSLHSAWVGTLVGLLIFGIFVYAYQAMRNFYKQGWFKTFVKFFLLNIMLIFVVAILFAIFTFFSFFNI